MKLSSILTGVIVSPVAIPANFFAIPLRLIVGFGFLQHGFAKLLRGGDAFVGILVAMHLPFPELLGWATVVMEILCGALILIGAFVPLAAIPAIIILLVAIFTAHLPYGFSSIKLLSYDAMGAHFGQPGYETDLLYIASILALVIGGAGPFSVEAILRRRLLHRGK
ncbi:DoxX family protein [Pantoea sp. BL1]|uniref:DoxX family protein n=1 Tax=Pantoea TaxID=53335 RepID=UPI0005F874ED|nr:MULTISPECIES: DoxX family protein [unclassified Pantoea]KJV26528.1 DoxX family protein [Pantoea sp. SM3]KJV48861.1 DoxX family protein [Pantoea sp. BL1]